VGERGSVPLGFFMFFVLALGLGLPFLFLAIFSGSIDRLPRSGAWMVWVRSIFGFILIAMAIYFLRPLFPDSLLYHAALTMTLLTGGVYMAWIEPTKMPGKAFPVIRNLIGLIFFLLALIFGTSGIRGYIEEKLDEIRMGSGVASAADMIQWQSFQDVLLQKAQESALPVLIDFYADWCIPCKELDKFTFTDPAIIELSRNFMMLKADLTTASDPLTARLKQTYAVKGVPTLIFLNSDGSEARELRVVGFIEKEELLEKMKAVH
jgi:thiol:disulfide interchange protein DsbD